ncbi:hypothetical protein [Actinacidiphila sp. ITFR-21]|uniref:hypothetical protein n=1 Tax=Actinacidiphila sp. ITFR-21 TaxID=3075199 RepID=UPI00288B1F84|nr:hypothetical protein [Streptomyces sp. ITFR-21]WNI15540.1 hypothetical protein RLT57_08390 [Streptomyces sp. ITFR-21]
MKKNPTFADQVPVFLGYVAIAAEFPDLPDVYVTTPGTHDLDIQATNAGDFEAWRSALNLSPDGVKIVFFQGSRWLAVRGVWRGLSVNLTTHGVDIPAEPEDVAPVGLPSEWVAAVSA